MNKPLNEQLGGEARETKFVKPSEQKARIQMSKSGFHPLQKAKHLMNRLETANNYRSSAFEKKIAEEKRHEKAMEQIMAEITQCKQHRDELVKEAAHLLPELKCFAKTHDALASMI